MFGVRRALLAAVVAMGVVGGPVALSEARAGATATLPVSVSGSALPGETVAILGSADVARRPVELQTRVGKKWHKVTTTHTDADGQFTFAVTVAPDPAQYRVSAADYLASAHEYAAAQSDPVTVTAAATGGQLTLAVAPIAQSRSGTKDLTPGTATFSPVRRGAPVRIQRQTDNGWVDVLSGAQDASGSFNFAVHAIGPDGPYSFRALSTPAGGAPIVSATATSMNWTMTFNNDFDGDAADNTFGTIGPDGHGGSRSCSVVGDQQTVPLGNALQLHINLDPAGVPAGCDLPTGTVDAAISSQDTQTFKYGVFAARIKYESGGGQHGSFWMLPARGGQPGDPATVGTEIDVSEYFGDGRADGGLQNKVYWNNPGDTPGQNLQNTGYLGPATKAILGKGNTPSNGYHVYSVEWTPTEYIFRLDGVETFRTSQGVSQQPEYLLLSLLSSDWEHEKLDPSSLPSAMKVDWVRVWQQN
jgi:beta-glucanase (GH16 family)